MNEYTDNLQAVAAAVVLHGATWMSLSSPNLLLTFPLLSGCTFDRLKLTYTVSGKKRPPQQNAVKCAALHSI